MITKGNWEGQYKYDNKILEKLTGFNGTNFKIDIVDVDDEQFKGSVTDDVTTGGMDGVGEITGKVIGNQIEFVKQMPVMMAIDTNGKRRTLNRKHRPIYYQGTFSDDAKRISGVWRFKAGFVWIGIIPVPVAPSTGTWEMVLAEK